MDSTAYSSKILVIRCGRTKGLATRKNFQERDEIGGLGKTARNGRNEVAQLRRCRKIRRRKGHEEKYWKARVAKNQRVATFSMLDRKVKKTNYDLKGKSCREDLRLLQFYG